MTNQQARRDGGKKAKTRGDLTELAVESALRRYEANKLLVWEKTYPEAKTLPIYSKGGKKVGTHIVYTSVGAPDWSVSLSGALLDSSLAIPLWMETKHVSDKPNTKRLDKSHQYDALLRNANMGGLSGYLVLWRLNGNTRRDAIDEWRYHPVTSDEGIVSLVPNKHGTELLVVLLRDTGILIPRTQQMYFDLFDGIDVWDRDVPTPDFLDTIIEFYKGGTEQK